MSRLGEGVGGLAQGGNSLKGACREVSSATPPLPQWCPPLLGNLSQPLPGVALVGQALACGCCPWNGEAGVDFSLPPRPRALARSPRLSPPTTASRGRGPRPLASPATPAGAVPQHPATRLEVGEPCLRQGPALRATHRDLGHSPYLEPFFEKVQVQSPLRLGSVLFCVPRRSPHLYHVPAPKVSS